MKSLFALSPLALSLFCPFLSLFVGSAAELRGIPEQRRQAEAGRGRLREAESLQEWQRRGELGGGWAQVSFESLACLRPAPLRTCNEAGCPGLKWSPTSAAGWSALT